ncbi:helix-turn-helix domain-containing protein [Microbacterium lushaniae]|nr:helix-turn-helix domain-containing protein [Microbacterium lushaniae]KAA9159244.1 helix-turn-helix domain-containing protein [Microbacterium lushaniae]
MSTAENIGERIRRIRQARGVSLRKVAQQLGVSPSLISQVETGKSRPSVATLYSLAGLLEVSADELLGIDGAAGAPSFAAAPPLTPEVQRASENPMIEMEDGVRWERLASRPDGRTDSLLVTYEAGASSSPTGKLTRHSGFEQAFILEGELILRLEFDEYTLGPGDSLQFESARPHLYLNRSSAPARGVWFVMDRNGAGLEAEPGADGARWRPHPPANPLNVLRRFDHLD